MEAVMNDLWSSRWLCWSLPALVSTLGLMPLVATVPTVLAEHAIGAESQIRWQARLLAVEEAMARGDLLTAERLWRGADVAALKSRHWQGMVAARGTHRALRRRAGFRSTGRAQALEGC